jgi:ankyrin repeat protein
MLTYLENQFLDACSLGQLDKVRELIVKIESINYFDDASQCPLWRSISEDHCDVAKFLLQNGANIYHTHLSDNVMLEAITSVPMLELLIDYGLDIYNNENSRVSSLYFIMKYHNQEVACKLVDLGVKYQHLDLSKVDEKIIYHIEKYEATLEKEKFNQILNQNKTKRNKKIKV